MVIYGPHVAEVHTLESITAISSRQVTRVSDTYKVTGQQRQWQEDDGCECQPTPVSRYFVSSCNVRGVIHDRMRT